MERMCALRDVNLLPFAAFPDEDFWELGRITKGSPIEPALGYGYSERSVKV